MSSHDGWEDERAQLLFAVEESERGRVSELLDRAARAARADGLREAARWLEEARSALVAGHLFRRWDNGILVFSSLIRHVRAMSSETNVPREYRRLLDAIPSTGYEARMSRAQTEFWYGPAPPGEAESPSEVVMSAVVVVIIVVVYWLFW